VHDAQNSAPEGGSSAKTQEETNWILNSMNDPLPWLPLKSDTSLIARISHCHPSWCHWSQVWKSFDIVN
jgi:hypothetical protein